MPARTGERPAATIPVGRRCRCGHWPGDHMVVVPIGTTGNFRLEPSGPCALCGDTVCLHFAPAPG